MNYFIFLIALSARVSGNNYYENLNLDYNQHLIKYETQNLFDNENLYTYENDIRNSVRIVNCDGLGQSLCPNTKQPLCATNGQHYLYFENPCQLEKHNYEQLIQGRQEYFQCPLYLCKPQCSQCPDVHDPACAMELESGKAEIFKNSCEVDRRACLTNKAYSIVSRTKCSQQSTQNSHCPEFLCTRDYRPVCAQFNNELKEFSNNCELERAKCFTNIDWQFIHEGPCVPVPNNTEPESTKCPNICTLEYRPICAEFNNELRQFGNNCELQRTRCQTNNDWQFVHEGPCYPVPGNTEPQPPKCPDVCTLEYRPICAKFKNELREFGNNCELQRTRCQTSNDWQFVHEGRCYPVPENTEPQPPKCPDVCTLEFRPICAKFNNELREFGNNCELQRTRCQTNNDWQFVHEGPCYPVSGNIEPQPPKCPDICTLEYRPICAKFKNKLREFGNNCELQRSRCQTNDDWQFVHEGPCYPVPDNTESQPAKCPDVCTLEYRPICAKFNNELREFGNSCALHRTRCQTNNDWQVVNVGPCPDNSTECPKFCTKELNPICARYLTETREFSNICELRKTICETNIYWQIERVGPCFSEPETQECPKFCTKELNPICARYLTETREFSNICELRRTICETNIYWQIERVGPCFSEPETQECPKFCTKELNPICARYLTETREFSNICELRRTICETNIYWQIERVGPCFSEPETQKCPTFCSREFRPVCARYGSVIREFSNSCELQRTICETDIAWTILNQGRCEEHQSPCENKEFEPICARFDFHVKTFKNLCELAEEIKITGNDWYVLYNGECQNLMQSTTTLEPYFTTAMSLIPPSTTDISTSSVDDKDFTSTTTTSPVVTAPESTTSSTEAPTFPVYDTYFSSSLDTSSSVDTTVTATPEICITAPVTTSPLTESTSSSDTVPITIPYATTTSYYGYSGGNYKKSLPSGYYGEATNTGIQKSYYKGNARSSKYPTDNFMYSSVNDQPYSSYNGPLTAYNPFLNFPGILTNQPLPDYFQFQPNNLAATQNSPTHQHIPDYFSPQPSHPSIIYKNSLPNQPIYDSIPDQTNSTDANSYGAQPPDIESGISNNPSQFVTFLSHIFNKSGTKQQLTEQSDSPFNQPQICASKTEDLQDFPYGAAEHQPFQIYPPFLPISFISLPIPSYNPAELPPIYPHSKAPNHLPVASSNPSAQHSYIPPQIIQNYLPVPPFNS